MERAWRLYGYRLSGYGYCSRNLYADGQESRNGLYGYRYGDRHWQYNAAGRVDHYSSEQCYAADL
jgi:hypothetical protein